MSIASRRVIEVCAAVARPFKVRGPRLLPVGARADGAPFLGGFPWGSFAHASPNTAPRGVFLGWRNTSRAVGFRPAMPGTKRNYEIARAVGERVKARRQAAGLSQRDLGYRTGLDNSMVSRYETGDYCPGLDSLCALAVAFGCEPGDLLPPLEGLAEMVSLA